MLSRNKGDNVFFCLLSQNKTKTRKVQLLSARARYCLVIVVVVVVVVVVVGVFVLSLSFVLRDFPLSNCESTFISHARLPNFPFRNDFFRREQPRQKERLEQKNWRSREGGDAAHEGVDAARSVSPARTPLLK